MTRCGIRNNRCLTSRRMGCCRNLAPARIPTWVLAVTVDYLPSC